MRWGGRVEVEGGGGMRGGGRAGGGGGREKMKICSPPPLGGGREKMKLKPERGFAIIASGFRDVLGCFVFISMQCTVSSFGFLFEKQFDCMNERKQKPTAP